MNWMAKTRPGAAAPAIAHTSKPGPASAPANANLKVRTSNGLKEFLWLMSDVPHARVLDLGPVWQATVNFFLEKGYRISTDDLLGTWKEFVSAEEERLRAAPLTSEGYSARLTASALADKFLENALQYPEDSFHGVLGWDLFDYFDPAVSSRIMDRLFGILHPGGRGAGAVPQPRAGAVPPVSHHRHADRGAGGRSDVGGACARVSKPGNSGIIREIPLVEDLRRSRSGPRRPFPQVNIPDTFVDQDAPC